MARQLIKDHELFFGKSSYFFLLLGKHRCQRSADLKGSAEQADEGVNRWLTKTYLRFEWSWSFVAQSIQMPVILQPSDQVFVGIQYDLSRCV